MALTKNDLKLIGKQTKDIVHEVMTDFYQNLFKVEFVAKKDFQEFKQEMREFKQEMEEFKQEMREFRNKVLTGQDNLFKELQEMRNEQTVLHYRVYNEHQPQLEKHDQRISALETAIAF